MMLTRRVVFLLAIATALCGHAQTGPSQLRYKFRVGDHLIYRETFTRETTTKDSRSVVRATFENHLMVVAVTSQGAVLGAQRNRLSAEMLKFRRRGKDVLAQEKPKFEQQMAARPVRFADANIFASEGFPLLPLQAVRESSSKLLYMVSEIVALPTPAVQVGSEWDEPQYAMTLRLTTRDSAGCDTIQDSASRTSSHITFTFCGSTGLVTKIALEGGYPGFGDTRYYEKVAFELAEVHHEETPVPWLADVKTQQGALTAYLASSRGVPDQDALNSVLRGGTPEVQALALAVLLRQKQSPSAEVLASLKNSPNAQVQRIAKRFGAPPSTPPKPGLCSDYRPPSFAAQKPGTNLAQMKSAPNAPYIVHVPIDYSGAEPFPLIVYLSGGDGYAFDGAASAESVLRNSGYLAVYPQANGLWWDQQPTQTFSAVLGDMLKNYNVDTDRIYLAGYSNGGTATVYYGVLWPQRFAALSAMMGSGYQVPTVSDPLPMKNIGNVPLQLLHGDQDPTIPAEQSQMVFDAVKGARPRVQPELHIYKGRVHDITIQRDDGLTLPFLERFRREPFPRSIEARILNADYAARHYWIEVLEKKGSYAEVQGRVKDDNTVEVKASGVKRMKLLLRPELFTSSGPIRVVVNGKARYSGELKRDCSLFAQSAEKYADPVLAYTDEVSIDLTK